MLNQSCILGFKKERGTSLAVQWLRLQASTAGGIDSIPSWGTKILFAVPLKKKEIVQSEGDRVKMLFPSLRNHPSKSENKKQKCKYHMN